MSHFWSRLFEAGWQTSPYHLMAVAWMAWAVSWMLAAVWARRAAARASLANELPYRVTTLIGVLLLFGFADLERSLFEWPVSDALAWIMLVFVVAGFAFAWWARIHLGTLWSGTITRKQDHRIVDSGPYGLVRHPIYTGLILSAFATAVARGRVEALAGAALFALGCWMKARIEERFLAEGLGEAAYAGYRARVPMLIPFSKGRAA